MSRGIWRGAILALAGAAMGIQAARAQDAPDAPAIPDAWEEARAVMRTGPSPISLNDEGQLALPAETVFIPRPQADALMRDMGNQVDGDFLGLVFPSADDAQWFAALDYVDDGHIADEEARDWDADAMLDSLRDGTENGNTFRENQGVSPIEVTGWIERPRYEPTMHQLVWSVGIKDKGLPAKQDDGVNYNIYVLGREGYLSLNFITSQDRIDAEKAQANQLLQGLSFNDGRRYDDFRPSSDRMAGYGIAALVGGVALKKLGAFALIGAFVAKFAKIIAVAFFALLGPLYKKLFRREG